VSDEVSEVFVTPPPSPPAACASLGPCIATAPCTSTQRLSDVFTAQVLDIPVPSVDPGRVPMTAATLGPAPAGGRQ
jgi:hypothetical protein